MTSDVQGAPNRRLMVDSKNDLNLAAQGNFSKTPFSQAKSILERLIEAKRSYETSRGQCRRGAVHAAEARSDEKLEARFEQMEKKLLEAVEKSRAPLLPAPKEKTYVPPPPEEHHYYYCKFPPEAEPQTQVNAVGHWNLNGNWTQGKQRDVPWRDHPNFRWSDQSPSQPPQPSTQQIQPSEAHPNWPARKQERPNNGGNRMQGGQGNWSGGPQGNWSISPQGNWSSGGQPNWSGRHQGPQPSNSRRQPNNQVVSYVPPHQRGNQQHPGNQQYHQPQYQPEHYGPSDFP
ncbi:basic salivary proline-rich protein 4-like [Salvia splendens]|uniref:basic salivary proline-rich protein 4-like n=1 Tax=Salvia splendens TaxID=180675 RepID=UPI001C258C3C|nr:basic salivary proline-rich protein 4-like [Salvia splendens]